MRSPTTPAWQEAIAFVLTGVRFPELAPRDQPDLEALTAFLGARVGADVDPAELLRPHPLPPELAAGLGAAQLGAAVVELRRRLGVGSAPTAVAAPRALTADERRLLQDVPPHHGG